MFLVYRIKNDLNGMCYVGKTTRSLEKRIEEHKKANSGIGAAIREYGWENFSVGILEECDNLKKLSELENFWIEKLNCKYPHGYNMVAGYAQIRLKFRKFVTEEEARSQNMSHPVAITRQAFFGKWMIPIMHELSGGTRRFNELRRQFGISHSVLAYHLKILEHEGLIQREIFAEVPPRVEYSLTELGRTFQPVLDSIEIWGEKFIEHLKRRDNFERKRIAETAAGI